MPEGDTIHRTAASLQPLVGQPLTTAHAVPGPGLRSVPDLSRLVGATVTRVEARGKHLLIGFDTGVTLRTHLRMTGSWRIVSGPAPPTWPMRRATVILSSRAWTAVAFATPVVELLTDAGLRRSQPLRTLGPDLLADSFDVEEGLRRLRGRDAFELGVALMDQRAVAGIGNVYRSEVAFIERLDPWSPVAAFSDEQRRGVLATARRLLLANVAGRGRRSTTGRRGSGSELWVYGRAGRPCRRCGAAIRVARQGEQARFVWWCPRCQAAGRR